MISTLPSYVTTEKLRQIIQPALNEDIGSGDVTSLATLNKTAKATAKLIAKQDGILAGCAVFKFVFDELDDDVTIDWIQTDGANVKQGDNLATIVGKARTLMAGERLALNIIQRMSGIATMTAAMVEAVKPYRAQILDTRKTAPGIRLLDKWAVHIGGGKNHRMGLFDMILIKENHVAAAGGIQNALRAAQEYCQNQSRSLKIEIETRSLHEVQQVVDAGIADIVMLDNFARLDADGKLDVGPLLEAVNLINDGFKTEASGNVTPTTVREIASTNVDYISSGALTHSVAALDVSLLVDVSPRIY